MNYSIVLRNTFRLLHTSKLFWIFGVISAASEILFIGSIYSIRKQPIYCIPYPLLLLGIYFSLVAKAGLIYLTIQVVSNQIPTLSEVWNFCKTKLKGFVSFYYISIPLLIFSAFIVEIVRRSEIHPSLAWLIGMLATFLLTSWIIISICTMTLHNLEAGQALLLGLRVLFKNFLHVIVLNGIFLTLQVILIVSTGNAFLGAFVSVPLTVAMTLAYRVFIDKTFDTTLSNIHPTA